MIIERIRTDPDPYEPFLLSQAIRVGDLLFVSGQAGYDDAGQVVEGGFDAQAEQAFANLERALRAGGADRDRGDRGGGWRAGALDRIEAGGRLSASVDPAVRHSSHAD